MILAAKGRLPGFIDRLTNWILFIVTTEKSSFFAQILGCSERLNNFMKLYRILVMASEYIKHTLSLLGVQYDIGGQYGGITL